MLLIGMLDSPFVRRSAISARLLGIPFERADWSVGKDFDQIRKYSPLGRVPALVLDDGEVLCDSSEIVDYLDQLAGPARALLPPSGKDRRKALHIIALTLGASEKCREQIYERIWRPKEKWHEPWVERARAQMDGALGELDKIVAKTAPPSWLIGERLTQADITLACIYTLITDALGSSFKPDKYPALHAHTQRCESLPEFKETRAVWFAPAA